LLALCRTCCSLLCSAFLIGLVLDLFACHEMPLYMVSEGRSTSAQQCSLEYDASTVYELNSQSFEEQQGLQHVLHGSVA
jgi:hypothetical protein